VATITWTDSLIARRSRFLYSSLTAKENGVSHMTARPDIGDCIRMHPIGTGACVVVAGIPDSQPLEPLGVLAVTDGRGEQHLIGREASAWVATTIARLSDEQFEAYEDAIRADLKIGIR
jgi:hypothetical protein